jgi:hypothetical protein
MPATWACSAPVAPPSTSSRSVHSRADGQSALRPRRVHPPKSRSALVVSHHLDGFLRFSICGLVASRCRSWGPPRFRPGRPTGWSARRDASPRCRIRTLRRTPRRQPHCVAAAVAFLPFSRDHRPRSQRTVASASSVEVGGSRASAPRPCSIVGSGIRSAPLPAWADPLLPGLRSSSRSFQDSRRSLSCRREPPPEPPKGIRVGKAPFRARSEPAEADHTERRDTRSEDRCRAMSARTRAGRSHPSVASRNRGESHRSASRWDPIPPEIPPRVHRACECTARPTDWRTSRTGSRLDRRT